VTDTPNDPEALCHFGQRGAAGPPLTDADLEFAKASELMKTFNPPGDRKKTLDPQVVSGLAAVAENRAKWKWPRTYLKTLLQINPKDVIGMQRMARALFQQTRADECLKMLKEAKKIAPNDVLTPESHPRQVLRAIRRSQECQEVDGICLGHGA